MAPASRPVRAARGLSTACFLLSGLAFAAGCLLTIAAAGEVVAFFYQPRVIAIVHTFTLGWISLAIVGVLLQYVPALTKAPLALPRLAPATVALFVAGAAGLVTHLWLRRPAGLVWSAVALLAGTLLIAAHLGGALWRSRARDVTAAGLAAALLCLVGTAALGVLLAARVPLPWARGGVTGQLAAHAHLGLLGWVTLTMCVMSYRMSAAFLMPTTFHPAAVRWQVGSLAALVPALTLSLLAGSRATLPLALLVALSLVGSAWVILEFARARRLPIDWSTRHVAAAYAHLAGAGLVALLLLTAVDATSRSGSRLVVVYGVLLLFGWITNYIVGFGSRMMPGLIGAGGRPLLDARLQAAVHAALNLGILAMIAAVGAGHAAALRLATALPLGAGAVFTVALWRRRRRRAPAAG